MTHRTSPFPLGFRLGVHALGLGLCCLCGFLAYEFAYLPFERQATTAMRQAEHDRQLRSESASLGAKAKELEANLQEQRGELADLLERLRVSPDGSDLRSHVSRVAAEHSIALKTFRPSSLSDAKPFSRLQVIVDLEGRYPDVVAFLAKLDEVPQMLHVASFEMRRSPSGGGTPMPVSLVLQVHYLPEAAWQTARAALPDRKVQ